MCYKMLLSFKFLSTIVKTQKTILRLQDMIKRQQAGFGQQAIVCRPLLHICPLLLSHICVLLLPSASKQTVPGRFSVVIILIR